MTVTRITAGIVEMAELTSSEEVVLTQSHVVRIIDLVLS